MLRILLRRCKFQWLSHVEVKAIVAVVILVGFANAENAFCQAPVLPLTDGPGWLHYFCNGSEQDPNGSATLQGVHCYPRLTVPSGATISVTDIHASPTSSQQLPRGEWLAFVDGPCTIAGTINAAAINGEYGDTGGSGGGGGGASSTNSGAIGFDANMFGGANYVVTGTTYNNPDFNVIHAARGGSPGSPGQSGGAGSTPTDSSKRWTWMTGDHLLLSGGAGGKGGGGSSAGGAGGYAGGGVVLICADSISFIGTINVSGGNGSPGVSGGNASGGGGGGGGGVVLMATTSYLANSGKISLDGGAGGSAPPGAGSGGKGGAGWSKQFALVDATPSPTPVPTPDPTPSRSPTGSPSSTPTPTSSLKFLPNPANFGSVQVGKAANQTVVVSNASQAVVSGRSITISGPYSFTNACPSSLGPGASCTVTVTFRPKQIGSAAGTLVFTENNGQTDQLILNGTGS